MQPVNSKVTAAAVGGAVTGGTVTAVVIQVLQRGFGVSPEWFTPEMVIVMTAAIVGGSAFVSGWLKKYVPTPPQ